LGNSRNLDAVLVLGATALDSQCDELFSGPDAPALKFTLLQ
jgi:hypothetical protein